MCGSGDINTGILTSAIDGREWSGSCPGCFNLIPHFIVIWAVTRTLMDNVGRGKFLFLQRKEPRSPGSHSDGQFSL